MSGVDFRARKPLLSIGDVSPIVYGGGFAYEEGDRIILEYTYGLEDSEDLPLYRVIVPDDVTHYYDWAKADMGISTEMSWEEIVTLGRSEELQDRVTALEVLTTYHGWDEFDPYPLELSSAELAKRWNLADPQE